MQHRHPGRPQVSGGQTLDGDAWARSRDLDLPDGVGRAVIHARYRLAVLSVLVLGSLGDPFTRSSAVSSQSGKNGEIACSVQGCDVCELPAETSLSDKEQTDDRDN